MNNLSFSGLSKLNPFSKTDDSGNTLKTSEEPVKFFGRDVAVDLGTTANWTIRKAYDSTFGYAAKKFEAVKNFVTSSLNQAAQGSDGSSSGEAQSSSHVEEVDIGIQDNSVQQGVASENRGEEDSSIVDTSSDEGSASTETSNVLEHEAAQGSDGSILEEAQKESLARHLLTSHLRGSSPEAEHIKNEGDTSAAIREKRAEVSQRNAMLAAENETKAHNISVKEQALETTKNVASQFLNEAISNAVDNIEQVNQGKKEVAFNSYKSTYVAFNEARELYKADPTDESKKQSFEELSNSLAVINKDLAVFDLGGYKGGVFELSKVEEKRAADEETVKNASVRPLPNSVAHQGIRF